MQNNTSKISPNNTIASSPKAERLPWLDFASGIMILWMVMYHTIGAAWDYSLSEFLGIIVLAGYVISYLAYRFNHRLLPYWIANGAAGLSFFALGYAMRELETQWWLIVPCAIVYVLGGIFGFPIVDMWPNDVVAGNYLLWIPVAFCCIVTFNAVCRIISQYIRIKPIEWVGQNAISIYVIHALIITMIVELILSPNHINISSVCIIGLIILAYIVLFPLCVWLKNWI